MSLRFVISTLMAVLVLLAGGCKTGNKPSQGSPTGHVPMNASVAGMQWHEMSSAEVPVTIRPTKSSGQTSKSSAFTYTDNLGKHILLLTETKTLPARALLNKAVEPSASAHLSGTSYLLKNSEYKKEWHVQDFIEECPVDIVAKFIPGTLHVTDLDRNGVAEVWLMYATVCHGDVSPLTLKIIMYQGNKKFALRGQSLIELPYGAHPHDSIGGNYQADRAFQQSPSSFLHHADSLWQANKRQDL